MKIKKKGIEIRENLKIILEIRRNKSVVNTFENEKTNLIKLLSYMSGRALKGTKCYYKIKVVNSFNRNGQEYGNIEVTFDNEKDLVYRWYNIPLDSYGVINEQDIIKILEIG